MEEEKSKKTKEELREKPETTREQNKHQDREEKAEDTGRADFGGIPDRDLKKNLGCG